jgi:hypothetical protein
MRGFFVMFCFDKGLTVAQYALELPIFLLQPPEFWNYKCAPTYPAQNGYFSGNTGKDTGRVLTSKQIHRWKNVFRKVYLLPKK